jgi:hypothetical protein
MARKLLNPNPALIRLGAACEALGVTREHLLGGVLDGTVPLRIVRIGLLCFFRAGELNAFMRGEPMPDPASYDLF